LKRDIFFLAGIRTRKEKVSAFGRRTPGLSSSLWTKQLFSLGIMIRILKKIGTFFAVENWRYRLKA
jgi:uncharacterized protein YmfQ (DUF2313 family)